MCPRLPLGDAELLSLGGGNAVIIDGVLSTATALAMRTAALRARDEGRLRPAGIGHTRAATSSVRGDHIAWIDAHAPLDPAFVPALVLFEAVRRLMNEFAYLGARDAEVQVAVYESSTQYERHVDRIRDTDSRRLTAIYYANPWTTGDGGELEVWEPGGVRQIDPVADRLVLFRSESVAHRVCPVTGPTRVAISGWLRR